MTKSVIPNTVYQRSPALRWRREVDNVTMYDTRTREVKLLNQVAALIWELLDGSASVNDIIKAVAEEFSAPIDVVTEDVTAFLNELCEGGYVTQKC